MHARTGLVGLSSENIAGKMRGRGLYSPSDDGIAYFGVESDASENRGAIEPSLQ